MRTSKGRKKLLSLFLSRSMVTVTVCCDDFAERCLKRALPRKIKPPRIERIERIPARASSVESGEFQQGNSLTSVPASLHEFLAGTLVKMDRQNCDGSRFPQSDRGQRCDKGTFMHRLPGLTAVKFWFSASRWLPVQPDRPWELCAEMGRPKNYRTRKKSQSRNARSDQWSEEGK
jgi:hypothetical protein